VPEARMPSTVETDEASLSSESIQTQHLSHLCDRCQHAIRHPHRDRDRPSATFRVPFVPTAEGPKSAEHLPTSMNGELEPSSRPNASRNPGGPIRSAIARPSNDRRMRGEVSCPTADEGLGSISVNDRGTAPSGAEGLPGVVGSGRLIQPLPRHELE